MWCLWQPRLGYIGEDHVTGVVPGVLHNIRQSRDSQSYVTQPQLVEKSAAVVVLCCTVPTNPHHFPDSGVVHVPYLDSTSPVISAHEIMPLHMSPRLRWCLVPRPGYVNVDVHHILVLDSRGVAKDPSLIHAYMKDCWSMDCDRYRSRYHRIT